MDKITDLLIETPKPQTQVFPIFAMPSFYLDFPRQKTYGKQVAVTTTPKVGRNVPCPCNSGKKK